ncbi:putative Ig domain-containing protein, partial [Escherichia coli]|uniref:putative Ig domain-containing protein n=1 Tax=Escherichia coli TaxID=562 RepID=UPI00215A83E7
YTVQIAADSNNLPPGITLDADHLRLMGTYTQANPTYGSIDFRYTVVDAVGRRAEYGAIWFTIGAGIIVEPPLNRVYV